MKEKEIDGGKSNESLDIVTNMFIAGCTHIHLVSIRSTNPNATQVPSRFTLILENVCTHTCISLVPRPPPFFVLRFVFGIIHGSGRA